MSLKYGVNSWWKIRLNSLKNVFLFQKFRDSNSFAPGSGDGRLTVLNGGFQSSGNSGFQRRPPASNPADPRIQEIPRRPNPEIQTFQRRPPPIQGIFC